MQGGHCACCLPGHYSLQLCSLMLFSPCFCIPSLSHDMFEQTRDGNYGYLPWPKPRTRHPKLKMAVLS